MPTIALQLYTIREETARDFLGAIERVAQVGYPAIELSGYFGTPARVLRRTIEATGLKVAGSIIPFAAFEHALEAPIEYAIQIGAPALICPWIDESRRLDAEGYRKVAEQYNSFGALCRKNNLQFAHHVHGYEFKDLGQGQTGMKILAERMDPALANFELDTYWVEWAGVHAVQFMQQYGERCPFIHFKDFDDRQTFHDTEVGAGLVDMAGVIVEARRHHTEWYIVEQEQYHIPPLQSIAISLDNLRRLAGESARP